MYFRVQQVFIEHLLYQGGALAFVAGERDNSPAYVTDEI